VRIRKEDAKIRKESNGDVKNKEGRRWGCRKQWGSENKEGCENKEGKRWGGCENKEGGRRWGWGGGCGKKWWNGDRAKFFCLQQQALRLMETGDQEKIQNARALFQEQLTIFQHFIPMYNIACCEALLGNSKEALASLQKAIAAGYRDADHIEKDEDLKSVRDLDEFKAIVSSLKSASTAAKSPVAPTTSTATTINSPTATTTTAHVEKPVATPVAETKPVEPAPSTENLALLEGMGFTDKQKNVEALTRAKGDMATAVQILIDGQRLYKWY